MKKPTLQRPPEDEFLFGVSVPSLRMSNSMVLTMSLQEEGLASVGRGGAAARSFGPTAAEIEAAEAMENLRDLLDDVQRLVPEEDFDEDEDDGPGHGQRRGHRFAKDADQLDKPSFDPELHVIPCIVREIMRAPVHIAPAEVGNMMEAGLSYHNASQYGQALDKFDQAEKVWAEYCAGEEKEKEEHGASIPAEGQLFLRCARGSVHESAGNDELALQEYLEGRKCAMQLDAHHPDVAVSYSCIGSVCYHVSRCCRVVRSGGVGWVGSGGVGWRRSNLCRSLSLSLSLPLSLSLSLSLPSLSPPP